MTTLLCVVSLLPSPSLILVGQNILLSSFLSLGKSFDVWAIIKGKENTYGVCVCVWGQTGNLS